MLVRDVRLVAARFFIILLLTLVKMVRSLNEVFAYDGRLGLPHFAKRRQKASLNREDTKPFFVLWREGTKRARGGFEESAPPATM